MEKKKENKTISAPVLTRASLWDAIKDFLEDDSSNDIRHKTEIRTILNDLYNPAIWNIEISEEDKKEAIERKKKAQVKKYVGAKGPLVTYTFFLQSCPQFDYLWSYLLKKIDGFELFVLEYENFIDKFIDDINKLHQNIKCKNGKLWYCVNDFIWIKFSDKKAIEAKINFENLSSSLQKSKIDGYILSLILEKTTIGVFTIWEKTQIEDIAGNIKF